MAPIRPMPKTSTSATATSETAQASDSVDFGFRTSKKDKRTIKHSAFVSKIEKTRKKPLKRRRPSKKLVADLNSLADALPSAGDAETGTDQVNIIKHKSLKHRPGAMKRKEKLDKVERDRFAMNMAQMATGVASQNQPTAEAPSADRWAALRNFISQTIDQNPEFKREDRLELLKEQIVATELHLLQLRQQLTELESLSAQDDIELTAGGDTDTSLDYTRKVTGPRDGEQLDTEPQIWPLQQEEYRRYGRQMIVDQIGLQGQLKLRKASVLIIGAGGLGCPAAMYLAGAGVGTVGIIDGDTVESSNLHRQILHRTKNVGKYKVDSAIEYLRELNPHPNYVPYRTRLTPQDAPNIFTRYDIVLDCTDNPATRYLISDTAVLLGKPVVSASALRTEGQLTILNYPPKPPGDSSGGPCYRCIFPKPPPADSVVSCADGGIIGPVVGLMGVMQALETIRVLTSPFTTETGEQSIVPSLNLFSAYSVPPFRNIRLRKRRANCSVCSDNSSIDLESLRSGSTDYVQFCGSADFASLLMPHERATATEYNTRLTDAAPNGAAENPILVDVRERVQYDICALPGSINIPISQILSSSNTRDEQKSKTEMELPSWLPRAVMDSSKPIYVVCRLGNDSQIAVQKLKEYGADRNGERIVVDIKGGLKAWRTDINPDFPDY
ncbi:Urmylation protein [Ophidiomyces ophidiicola]|uniref:Urmylation protein n=1 Tax=Ophidiomyces ophidiicola TaxID=1387563 RepID=UPI0020C28612|nr:Urmylation protein [Ophidiomyces ophidiicola]KAI1954203.1 Urmylation protein [Ophidiomyces ophidiicola]KAI2045600.1 Urmylation protein [Ophidiomyces ophidiicola]KAI2081378.1 Urmylation protein [Ophidiomyces ophidiicola]